MPEYVRGIRTNHGDLLYDYTALGNKPVVDKTLTVDGGLAEAKTVGNYLDQLGSRIDKLSGSSDKKYVPVTRKVNGKTLGSDIVLTYADVSAVSDATLVNGKRLNQSITLNADDVGALSGTDKSLTVQGKAADSKTVGDQIKTVNQNLNTKVSSETFNSSMSTKQDKISKVQATLWAGSDNWRNKTQTVSAFGVTPTNTVIVSPDAEGYVLYAESLVRCTAQGNGTLTFKCEDVPGNLIKVNIVVIG